MACGPELGVGEFGNFRYVGNVRGETPALPLLPPDRQVLALSSCASFGI